MSGGSSSDSLIARHGELEEEVGPQQQFQREHYQQHGRNEPARPAGDSPRPGPASGGSTSRVSAPTDAGAAPARPRGEARAASPSRVAALEIAVSLGRDLPAHGHGSNVGVQVDRLKRDLDSLSTENPSERALRWIYNDIEPEKPRADMFIRLFFAKIDIFQAMVSRNTMTAHPRLNRLLIINGILSTQSEASVNGLMPHVISYRMRNILLHNEQPTRYFWGRHGRIPSFDQFRVVVHNYFAAYDAATADDYHDRYSDLIRRVPFSS